MAYIEGMNRKNSVLIAVLLLFGLTFVSAEELPFRGLSSSEKDRLEQGERIFRELDSYKDACLIADDSESRRLMDLLEEVDPNFLAEIMMVIPVDPKRDNLAFIYDILTDVAAFDDIPYYSARNEKWFKLFEDSRVLNRSEEQGRGARIDARHAMKPFKPHEARYEYRFDGDIFFFQSRNTSAIHYKNFKAVKEGSMLTLLWIRDEGDRLVIYGAGGAAAFTFFGIFGGRMDDAFVGRMDAFFTWFYENHVDKIRQDI